MHQLAVASGAILAWLLTHTYARAAQRRWRPLPTAHGPQIDPVLDVDGSSACSSFGRSRLSAD
jgi:hypothetical protein